MAVVVDWRAAAGAIADSVARPIFVLDADGEILLFNAGMERLVGDDRDRRGPFDPAAITQLVDAVQRRDLRRTQLVAHAHQNRQLVLEISVVPVRSSERVVAVVCVVEDVRRDEIGPPLPGEWVRVSASPDSFGLILDAKDGSGHLVGRPCYQAFAGQPVPCADCPLTRMPLDGSLVVDVLSTRDGKLLIERCVRFDASTAVVSYERIDPSRLSRLIAGRIATLARERLLSDREVQVLEYLVRGVELDQIGDELAISVRTVKFHQTNILAKLGLGSRLELLGLLVEPSRDQSS